MGKRSVCEKGLVLCGGQGKSRLAEKPPVVPHDPTGTFPPQICTHKHVLLSFVTLLS